MNLMTSIAREFENPKPSMFRTRHPLFAFIGWLTIIFVVVWVVWKFFLTSF